MRIINYFQQVGLCDGKVICENTEDKQLELSCGEACCAALNVFDIFPSANKSPPVRNRLTVLKITDLFSFVVLLASF